MSAGRRTRLRTSRRAGRGRIGGAPPRRLPAAGGPPRGPSAGGAGEARPEAAAPRRARPARAPRPRAAPRARRSPRRRSSRHQRGDGSHAGRDVPDDRGDDPAGRAGRQRAPVERVERATADAAVDEQRPPGPGEGVRQAGSDGGAHRAERPRQPDRADEEQRQRDYRGAPDVAVGPEREQGRVGLPERAVERVAHEEHPEHGRRRQR